MFFIPFSFSQNFGLKSEEKNIKKWIDKWGKMPDHDSETFVVPIKGTKVKTRLKWESFDETN